MARHGPSFLGRWSGRAVFWLCWGVACYVRYVPHK